MAEPFDVLSCWNIKDFTFKKASKYCNDIKVLKEPASSVLFNTHFGCPAGCGQMTPDWACRYATIPWVLLFFEYKVLVDG